MKKIFAIALALVMVLSMASAFASPCTAGFDWSCPTSSTNCGQGKVELVPYVKVNNGCGGYDWEVSTCAAAVASENIYWALKLTVDANPDMEWWNEAKLTLDGTEIADPNWAVDFSNASDIAGIDFTGDDSEKTQVYYALPVSVAGNWWINAEDDNFDVADVVFTSAVPATAKASKVKLCAELVSNGEDFEAGYVGDYLVTYKNDVLSVYSDLIANGGKLLVTYTITDDKVSKIDYTKECGEAAYETIKAFFGLDINTCVDQDLVNANFGWDFEQEFCLSWSDKAASIVDAECVVAIPKTGGASVLASLF